MKARNAVALLVVVALAATITSTGCRRVRLEDVEGPSGLESATKSIPLDGAEKLDARIRMAAGQFKLAGGASGAMDADFEASPKTWLPDVTYSVEGTAGVLRVTQPELTDFNPLIGTQRNEWDVKVASGIPSELDIELGAGESTIDLRDVDVRDLSVLTGAGETTIDLSGPRASDVTADLQAGVGQLTVKVPRDVGVRLTGVTEGIGEYTFDEFTKDGDAYVNDAWATSPVKIEIRLQRGVGEAEVIQVP